MAHSHSFCKRQIWFSHVHVCFRWKNVVFVSPSFRLVTLKAHLFLALSMTTSHVTRRLRHFLTSNTSSESSLLSVPQLFPRPCLVFMCSHIGWTGSICANIMLFQQAYSVVCEAVNRLSVCCWLISNSSIFIHKSGYFG